MLMVYIILDFIPYHTPQLILNLLTYEVLQAEQSLQVFLGIFHCGFLINGFSHD